MTLTDNMYMIMLSYSLIIHVARRMRSVWAALTSNYLYGLLMFTRQIYGHVTLLTSDPVYDQRCFHNLTACS